jgi:hypothetical protein
MEIRGLSSVGWNARGNTVTFGASSDGRSAVIPNGNNSNSGGVSAAATPTAVHVPPVMIGAILLGACPDLLVKYNGYPDDTASPYDPFIISVTHVAESPVGQEIIIEAVCVGTEGYRPELVELVYTFTRDSDGMSHGTQTVGMILASEDSETEELTYSVVIPGYELGEPGILAYHVEATKDKPGEDIVTVRYPVDEEGDGGDDIECTIHEAGDTGLL